MAASPRGAVDGPQTPALQAAPRRVAEAHARQHPGRDRARAHRGGSRSQPRLALPVPARQLFLLPLRLPRAGRGAGPRRRGRRRPAHPVLSREEPGARDLGRLSLRSRRRARGVRLRRCVSAGRDGRGARRPRCRPAGAVHAAGAGRRLGPQGRGPAERGQEPGAHRRRGARAHRRRAPGARRDAPGQGRARAFAPAGSSTRSRPSSSTSSCATAPRRSRIRRSSPAGPMRACCTIATTTASCRTASCC